MSDCSNCQNATGLTRREFFAGTSMVAVSAFLVACGDGSSDLVGLVAVNATVRVADFPALNTVGGIAQITGINTPVAVVRSATDRYRAFSLVCPHQGTTVAINGSAFRCPNHGATFNSSGAWTGGERTSGLVELTVVSNATAGTITITS